MSMLLRAVIAVGLMRDGPVLQGMAPYSLLADNLVALLHLSPSTPVPEHCLSVHRALADVCVTGLGPVLDMPGVQGLALERRVRGMVCCGMPRAPAPQGSEGGALAATVLGHIPPLCLRRRMRHYARAAATHTP
eukprot:g17155.t1